MTAKPGSVPVRCDGGALSVLVACEHTGVVRDAFAALGCDAWSCDLLPSETPGQHYQGDVRDVLYDPWDLVIAHPPCTYLCVSGIHWNARRPERAAMTDDAAEFFMLFTELDCAVSIENPICVMSTRYRKPDQIIQPWMFGHGETKATCLWLYGLPLLVPTNVVDGREPRIHRLPPSPDRWKIRSATYPGVASAMALQWTAALTNPLWRMEATR